MRLPSITAGIPPLYLLAGGGVLAALMYFKLKAGRDGNTLAGQMGVSAGGAVVDLAGGVLSGVVNKTGALVGIPQVDNEKCARDRAAGNTLAAMSSCKIGDFYDYMTNAEQVAPIAENFGITGSSW